MEITIYDKITPKQRPRLGKNGRIYTPKQTVQSENLIGRAFFYYQRDNEYIPMYPEGVPVHVSIEIYVKVPNGKTKKEKEQLLASGYPCTTKWDIDNMAKTILDGLNKLAYHDDKQVVKLDVCKKYALEHKTVIKIQKMG